MTYTPLFLMSYPESHAPLGQVHRPPHAELRARRRTRLGFRLSRRPRFRMAW